MANLSAISHDRAALTSPQMGSFVSRPGSLPVGDRLMSSPVGLDKGSGSDPAGPGAAGNASSPGGLSVNRRFRSSDMETRLILAEVRGHLAGQGFDAEQLGMLELILAEALNNITEHAYGPEGGPVELSIRLAPESVPTGPATLATADRSETQRRSLGASAPADTAPPRRALGAMDTIAAGRKLIVCEVRDYGRPMPAGGPPGPGLPPINPPDVLPEGGFGWHIIRCLVADLCYERIDDCNRLRMTLQAQREP